jgi:hypothetical protein
MANNKLHQEVLSKFIENLKSDEEFDDKIAEKLEKILLSEANVKPIDLVPIFYKENVSE